VHHQGSDGSVITRLIIGVVVLALTLGALALLWGTAGATGGHGACDGGVVSIVGTDNLVSYDASPNIITGVCIKSGTNMFFGEHSEVVRKNIVAEGCYTIDGINTSVVMVIRPDGGGRYCQGISHIDVLTVTPTPPPTPTSTPTPFTAEHCGMNDRAPDAPDCPTPTATPTVTPMLTSGIPSALPSTGGGGRDDFCRDWTTGQANDVIVPCSVNGGVDWLIVLTVTSTVAAALLIAWLGVYMYLKSKR